MVIKHKEEFVNLFGTLIRKLANNKIPAYVPILQQFNTFRLYKQDLGHTRARNIYEFLKVRRWWLTMRAEIKEVL